MIWQYFRLTATPFPVAPVADQACLLPSWQEHLDQLQATLQQQQGPAVILGSAGTGKTMLLAVLAQRLTPHFRVCHLRDGGLDNRLDFWKTLLFELGLPLPGADVNDCRRALLSALRQQPEFAGDLLLLIDEAHTLSVEVLEQLRLLSNIIEQGHSRVQFVLAGNQPLEEQLLTPQSNSLNQRIHCRVYLSGMGLAELFSYIDFHWRRVGGDQHPFSDEAVRALHTATLGIPRLVHQLADQALGFATQQHLESIDETSIQIAWSRWQHLPVPQLNRGSHTPDSAVANTASTTATTAASVVEFGSLDDGPPSTVATRPETPLTAPPIPVATQSIVTTGEALTSSEIASEIASEITTSPEAQATDRPTQVVDHTNNPPATNSDHAGNIASLVAAQQHAQSQTLIRFAFEADIQRPVTSPEPESASPPVSRSYQQWETAFDTLEQAIERVQQPVDAIEDLLIEADLQAIINPVEILHQSAVETRDVLAHSPAEVFQDHLYFETLWLQDTVWTQYIKEPVTPVAEPTVDETQTDAATLATIYPMQNPVSIPLSQLSLDAPFPTTNTAVSAKPMHANSPPSTHSGSFIQTHQGAARVPLSQAKEADAPSADLEIRIDVQGGRQVNPPQRTERWETVRPLDAPTVSWSAAEVELGDAVRTSAVPFNDDAAIIHRQPEHRYSEAREAVIHPPQTIEPPALARRKDLRALLHALRGY